MNEQYNENLVKISIIIPFYNIEDYVAQCLDSVLSQDMPDFEIIAVNDGSTDKTPSLLEEYAKKDSRVQVLHLENGGLSWARNHGVMKATGEYIWFVDGDDFILPNALYALYKCAKTNTADVVIFCHTPVKDGVFQDIHKLSYPENTVMDAFEATRIRLLDGDDPVWNKLISRELYMKKNILFEEGVSAEDVPVTSKILLNSQRVIYLKETFYAYIYRSASISNVSLVAKRIQDIFYCMDIMREEVINSKWNNELVAALDYRYIANLMGWLQNCYSKPKMYKSSDELKKVQSLLEDRFSRISLRSIIFNQYFRLSYKIKAVKLKSGIYKLEKMIIIFFRKYGFFQLIRI